MYLNAISAFSLLLLTLPRLTISLPHSQSQSRSVPLPLPYNVVHQYPNPTWLENLAFRPDNTLLTTSAYPSASLYLIDPASHSSTLVHTFTEVLAILGITELGHDKFYV